MPQAKSDLGFSDCNEFWDKALDSDKGWWVVFQEKGQAMNFRGRCYAARRRILAFNNKVYADGAAMKRQTVWDGISLHIRQVENGWSVLAVKGGLDALVVEQGPI